MFTACSKKFAGRTIPGPVVFLFIVTAIIVANYAALWAAETTTGKGYIEVENGRLYFEDTGEGYPLVFIHDGLVHSVVWDEQVAEFSKNFRVIRYDRRGYGLSDIPTTPYNDLDDLQAVVEHLGIDKAVFIGSSAGGGLAINYALEHPEHVDALVLVGAVVDGLGYSFHFMKRAYANYSLDEEANITNWVNDTYSIAPGNNAARERVDKITRDYPQNLDFAKGRLAEDPETAALGRLSEIDAPTLIVTAEHDIPDVHAHAGAIEAGIRGAHRIVLDDAGHLCYLEQPEAFNSALRVFLDRLTLPMGAEGVAARAEKPWSTFERGIVDVDGGEIYYEAMGEGPALVMIHGGLLDHRMWAGQFELFADRYRVIRYDVRGHGLSRSPFGARRDYEDLRILLDTLGIERAHIMGLSLGGRIAIDFALEHPERVLKLIPVAPGLSGYDFNSPEEQEYLAQIRAAYFDADFDHAADVFFQAWSVGPDRDPGDVDPAFRDRVLGWIRNGVDPGMDGGNALSPEPPALGRLGEITAPTLVVYGNKDMPGIIEIAGMIEKEVPGAKKKVIKNAGHTVNVERPKEFNEVVLEFLEKE